MVGAGPADTDVFDGIALGERWHRDRLTAVAVRGHPRHRLPPLASSSVELERHAPHRPFGKAHGEQLAGFGPRRVQRQQIGTHLRLELRRIGVRDVGHDPRAVHRPTHDRRCGCPRGHGDRLEFEGRELTGERVRGGDRCRVAIHRPHSGLSHRPVRRHQRRREQGGAVGCVDGDHRSARNVTSELGDDLADHVPISPRRPLGQPAVRGQTLQQPLGVEPRLRQCGPLLLGEPPLLVDGRERRRRLWALDRRSGPGPTTTRCGDCQQRE